MYDVVTFGSATVDVFAQTSDSDAIRMCTENGCEDLLAYHPGDKVLLEDLHVDIGGGGTNTAATLKRLGHAVAYAGCVGRDDHAGDVLSWLAETDIPFVGTRTDAPQNTSIILDSHKLQDRSILVYRGSSDRLVFDDLDLESLHATWWYFPSMLGESYQSMKRLLRYANERGIAVAVNPSSYQTQHGLDELREVFDRIDVVVRRRRDEFDAEEDEDDEEGGAEGAEIVVVTEGSFGASMLYADTIYHVESRAHDVVETTGAGDCFASSVVGALIAGLSVPDALRAASVNAENLIMHVGAKHGLLSLAQIRSRVDDRPVHQEPL